jgi:hypothetical protein
VVTTNQFSFGSSGFTGAVVHVIDKAALANNAASCPTAKRTVFRPKGFTLQPVQHLTKPSSFTGTTNPAYLVSSDTKPTNSGTSNLYHVYRVRNVGTGSPTLQGPVDVAGNYTYSVPPQAPQNGTTQTLDTGDTRILQAGGLGNVIWAVHTTGCVIGASTLACARAVRLAVGQDGSGNPTARLTQQTVFGVSNAFVFEPGVAVNQFEAIAVPFQLAGQGRYLGAFWTEKDPNASTFFSMLGLAQGACAQTESNQTGKYTGAATDPATVRLFYMAAEATATFVANNQRRCGWTTRINSVDPGIPVTTPP